MFKKMMLLAMAVAAMAAFAIPASASASEIIDSETLEPIPATTHLHYVGTAKFETAGLVSSVECPVTATIEMESASTGHVVNFTATNFAECVSGGALAGCQLKGIDSSFGWDVHVNAHDLTVTGASFVDTFEQVRPEPACPSEATFAAAELTINPTGGGQNIGTVDISGSGGVTIPGVGTLPATASGHLTSTAGSTWEIL